MSIEAEYFRNSRIWYQSIYLSSYYTRILYFFICLFSAILVYFCFDIYLAASKNFSKKQELYIVAYFSHTEEGVIQIYNKKYQNAQLNILDFTMSRFVKEIESLDYSPSDDVNSAILKKMKKVSNIFTKDLFATYSDFKNEELNSDVEYFKKGLKKNVSIYDVEFYNKDGKKALDSYLYRWFNVLNVDHIIVSFSVYNEMIQNNDNFEVYIKYDLNMPEKKTDEFYLRIKEYNKYKI